ncbi:hypothetical protein Nepgr_003938 [Nepenthes gracilis]|uniref:Uncharacterized protein n=1 Tax=Nepenthes gracilis TaxID=150966 RepID=A0AAD3XED5_NEPGR|nr:hypothetical protein Nepgr_003938 [Nepenthes gracilis]
MRILLGLFWLPPIVGLCLPAAEVPIWMCTALSLQWSLLTQFFFGDVDTDAASNPRNEHVLLSYSELSRFKDNGECLHAAGHVKSSYADITKRGVEIDGACPLSLLPFSTEDRLATLGRSFCHDEVIGSTEVGSPHDGLPADTPGGVPII